jgi:hypothetical protein
LPRNPRVNIYESIWVGKMTKLPLALKLRYKPLKGQIGHVALFFIARPHLRRSPRPQSNRPTNPRNKHQPKATRKHNSVSKGLRQSVVPGADGLQWPGGPSMSTRRTVWETTTDGP